MTQAIISVRGLIVEWREERLAGKMGGEILYHQITHGRLSLDRSARMMWLKEPQETITSSPGTERIKVLPVPAAPLVTMARTPGPISCKKVSGSRASHRRCTTDRSSKAAIHCGIRGATNKISGFMDLGSLTLQRLLLLLLLEEA
jgi:hypothetical protein